MIFSLPTFLTIGAILFVLGFYNVLVRKNTISVLMGIELILNGAALNFVAFGFFTKAVGGGVMVLFIIALAALETAVALAIILSIFWIKKSTFIDQASSMRD